MVLGYHSSQHHAQMAAIKNAHTNPKKQRYKIVSTSVTSKANLFALTAVSAPRIENGMLDNKKTDG